MCIVLVTRTKKYSIILSNRDEFLARPTVRATWWPSPHEFVIGGRDLARPSHGTWLGMTRHGRIAVLTNYREDTEQAAGAAAVSRGEITKEFLFSDKPVDEWVLEVLSTGVYKNVGGFSLMCGVMRKDTRGYAIVTNRSSIEKGANYVLSKEDEVLEYECEGLSNALIHDEWPKVKMGKMLLQKLKEGDIQDENSFIEQCFELLSTNSFTETPTVDTLCDSIFIPRYLTPAIPSIPADHTNPCPEWLACDHPRWYGTREQTVILVSHEDGRVVYVERTLWDEDAQPLPEDERESRAEFFINGWNDCP